MYKHDRNDTRLQKNHQRVCRREREERKKDRLSEIILILNQIKKLVRWMHLCWLILADQQQSFSSSTYELENSTYEIKVIHP